MEFIKLHHAAKDISNQRFGRLLTLGPVGVKKFASGANHVQWLCLCDCGTEKIISIAKLSTGNTKSCGCLRREMGKISEKSTTHGMCRSAEYEIWHGMKRRCLGTSQAFKHYGGRGITVCDRWQKFENFFADMGPRPSALHTIERTKNDGGYEPSNCYWATLKQQARNRRNNRIVEAFGRREPLVCFIEDSNGYIDGRRYQRAIGRLNRGWNPEKALTEPARSFGRR